MEIARKTHCLPTQRGNVSLSNPQVGIPPRQTRSRWLGLVSAEPAADQVLERPASVQTPKRERSRVLS
jgi:hypothetical protein